MLGEIIILLLVALILFYIIFFYGFKLVARIFKELKDKKKQNEEFTNNLFKK